MISRCHRIGSMSCQHKRITAWIATTQTMMIATSLGCTVFLLNLAAALRTILTRQILANSAENKIEKPILNNQGTAMQAASTLDISGLGTSVTSPVMGS
mmetsp:Transcript_9731/g.20561  ORF Transcript_9731/g.20561 Transcript_9731/m.20561 type:complete len:99 (+) Transcript_9731:1160-1456(+)